MNWLNLEIRMLRSAAYIGSDPVERATWLNILAYCCEQENGGRLDGARLWKDRQWQQVCGVTMKEVGRATRLIAFEGDDLLVLGYPLAKEAEVKNKREAGREGGLRSGEARAKQERSTASSCASRSASTEGEGKEKGKEIEGERKEKGTPHEPPKSAPKRAASDTDEEWLAGIEAMECYKSTSVHLELGKAKAWAITNHRQCTRKFFINWLNRSLEDRRVVAQSARVAAPEHDLSDTKF